MVYRLVDGKGRARLAVVTGGAGGIGAATCRRLTEAGAAVLVTDVQTAAGESLAAELRSAGHLAWYHDLDVGSED
ncbi:MAG: SDR family NAD(P)-dependent oxidoreductase, partial [Steroidobacteraceae bacterium]